MAQKWVYRFGGGVDEGPVKGGYVGLREQLGNKGANLAKMARMGLPVPPGFTLTTEACRVFLDNGGTLTPEILEQIQNGIVWLEDMSGRRFGEVNRPLLVSVRSGAKHSMPGMMDTVLDLGLNDENVARLLQQPGRKRFVLDCYRRFIQMYGIVVFGIDDHFFDDIIHGFCSQREGKREAEISDQGWSEIIEKFKHLIASIGQQEIPQDIEQQLFSSIKAVFFSWNTPRAMSFRALQGFDDLAGTAVTIQMMVYGNRANKSASGVAFSRHISSGETGLYGEYLPNVQGEDIVDGYHSPQALSEAVRLARKDARPSLQTAMPARFVELETIALSLEKEFRDMQEIEFTIENDKLWLLQTRAAKRSIEVAIKVALDLLDSGVLTRQEAIGRISKDEFHKLMQPAIVSSKDAKLIARGIPASPGAACGAVVFTSQKAVELGDQGILAILVRNETSPNDIKGMNAACGILTRRGGATSHAANIARSIGRPCIVDARQIKLDMDQKSMQIGDLVFFEGDQIILDGSTGHVLTGKVVMHTPKLDENARRFKALLDQA